MQVFTLTQLNLSPKSPSGYYGTVFALTPKESIAPSQSHQIISDSSLAFLFSPLLIYGTVILFFGLFIGAMVIQIISKSLDMKKTLTSLIVAFVLACIPFTLKTALEITSLQTRAGPDEVPRNIEIRQTKPNSVTIKWSTVADMTGSVRYSKVPFSTQTAKLVIGDLGKRTIQHTVIISDLDTEVEYEVEILSGSMWYDNDGQPLRFHLSSSKELYNF